LPFQLVWSNRRDGAYGHAKIRVRVMRTKTAIGMLITQTKQNFSARKSYILEQIPSVIGQAAPMRVHVANSDLARDPGIEHLECGIERAQFRVPGDFSLADQFGNHCRANRFGYRRQLE